MVSTISMAGMVLQIVFAVCLPIAVCIYFHKREAFQWKPLMVGMVIFVVFALVLEKLLHVYMLQLNPQTAQWLSNPWMFAVYGSLAAGVFEELGRYIGFRVFLRRADQRKDGIAYGIGHGGIETVVLGAVVAIQSLVFAIMLNNGTLEPMLAGQAPPEAIAQLKSQLTGTPSYMIALVMWERGVALLLQIALSLVVLHSIRSRKPVFLLYAIVLHAAINFLPAMYQAKAVSIWVAEAVLVLVIPVIWYIFLKSKRWWSA
ncbi:YhfC family intramembrane metalloprotease [Paenibacillus sp. NPDC056579]|uniref:YhfC family intramembrane metalloprotease n=1 Tax=Paenibacillus sp. NPDC056579 TaxID=3345871 RepID=UPI00368555F0